jgi:NAD(P)-dependent dehydrogenase (short-subunit alcohol dehydrogenase family)
VVLACIGVGENTREVRQLRVAVVNIGDDIGISLVDAFCDRGTEVLGIDEEENTAVLRSQARSLVIDTRVNPQALAEFILGHLREAEDVEVLINNFGQGLATARMAEGHLWALSASPQVRASFAATRAFLSVRKQTRGLVVNIGLGIGPSDEHCPMRYTLLGFAHALGLMELDKIDMVNLCCHGPSEDKTGLCCRCASDSLALADVTTPFQHFCLTSYREVSVLVLRAVDRFRESLVVEAVEG